MRSPLSSSQAYPAGLGGAYPSCPQESSLRKRVSACFWKKVLIRSGVFSISISPIPPRSLSQTEKPDGDAWRPFPQAKEVHQSDGFFSCGSYQSESLARTFDLSRSTFRAHVLNKFGTHLLHIRDMLLKPIDKTFKESPKCRSIEPSDSSN